MTDYTRQEIAERSRIAFEKAEAGLFGKRGIGPIWGGWWLWEPSEGKTKEER